MNKNIEAIQSFVLSQRDYFSEGLDISDVRRKYRREEGISIGREDTCDALINLKKDGILSYNFKTMKMDFTDD